MHKSDKNKIDAQVKKILIEQLDVDAEKVRVDAILADDLGMDSFGAIEVIFALEDKFGLEIPERDLENVKTVENIIEYIKTRKACIESK